MQRPATINNISEVYAVDSILSSLDVPLSSVTLDESCVIVQKSMKEHDTSLNVAAAAAGPIGILIASSVFKEETLKEVDGVAPLKAFDLTNAVYSLLKDMQSKQELPNMLTPVTTPGNGFRYELHPYLYVVPDGLEHVDVLVAISVSLFDADDDEIWDGQYARHIYPLVPKATVKDEMKMRAILVPG
ncbi:MAG: hypothetical protein ABW157_05750 [Candidatus Thiodiazotropha sp. LLP2]